MAYNPGDEDKSTWKPLSEEQRRELERLPQPQLQIIPATQPEIRPSRIHREISGSVSQGPSNIIQRDKTKTPTLH